MGKIQGWEWFNLPIGALELASPFSRCCITVYGQHGFGKLSIDTFTTPIALSSASTKVIG
jgi:hypothetical protein